MPKDNNQQPITPTNNSDDQFPVFVEETLPPMPQGIPTTPNVPPAPEKKDLTPTETPITTSGSAAPQDDAIMPPVVTSKNKKKFAGGKVIATILGLFLLVGGVGAGVLLVSQNQDINEKASADCPGVYCDSKGCYTGGKYANSFDVNIACYVNHYVCTDQAWPCGGSPINGGIESSATFSNTCNTTEQIDLYCPKCGYTYEQGSNDCINNPNICQDSTSIKNPQCDNPVDELITASCSNIKAYTESWVLIDEADLPNLSVGDNINFCVSGVTSSGSFDMARITVNGANLPDATENRPGTNDFCSTYVIPPAATTFNITSQIHHISEGWR